MKPSITLIICLLTIFMTTQVSGNKIVSTLHQVVKAGAKNDYIGNLYVYYTWNTSFVMCGIWGFIWILFTADRGLAYSTCMANF